MPGSSMNDVVQQLRQAILSGTATTPDGELLRRFVSHKDREAVATLVRRHGAMVWGVCRRVLASEPDAEDAFQATFLVLLRRANSIWPREMVANWLYGVARQTALKARAMTAARRSRERQLKEMPDPLAQRNQTADIQMLEEELSRLPEQYRIAIVLCDLEGRTRKDAAHLLGWPEGTVAGRLARARKMLAKRLRPRGIMLAGGCLAVLANEASAGAPTLVVSATIAAIKTVGTGNVAFGGAISGKVAALTEGVLKAMLLTKLTKVTATLVVLGMLAFMGGGITRQTSLAQTNQVADSQLKSAEAAPKKAAAKGEQDLHGTWKVVSLESDNQTAKFDNNLGKILPIDVPVTEMAWTFTDKTLTILASRFAAKAAYSVDKSKAPHRLNLVFEVDLGNTEMERLEQITVLGIFSHDGNELKVCLGNASGDRPFRPLRFASSAGSSPTSLYCLRRSTVDQTSDAAVTDERRPAAGFFRTANFDVHAADEKTAKLMGEHAEKLRKSQGMAWLGQEMPTWQKRCPIRVQITTSLDGTSWTKFSSEQSGPVEMELKGPLDTLLDDELPLQIGHAVLQHDLGELTPRWAGAGMGSLDRSVASQVRYMESCGELLAKDKLIPLRKLLPATEYPKDMIPFYPQSYSLTRFLVTQKGRATFLAFVGLGMRKDWDSAIRRFYGFDGIDALETAWQQSLVFDRFNPPDVFVRGIVQKIDSNDPTLVQISVGADAGLKEGHTLEVFRLKPQPKYLGLIRIMNVQPSVSIGRRIGTAVRSGALEPGDQVISRFDEKQK